MTFVSHRTKNKRLNHLTDGNPKLMLFAENPRYFGNSFEIHDVSYILQISSQYLADIVRYFGFISGYIYVC